MFLRNRDDSISDQRSKPTVKIIFIKNHEMPTDSIINNLNEKISRIEKG